MVNRNTNNLQGLFGFPFFTQPQQTFNLHVEDKEKELVFELTATDWKKENISIELVRNGILFTVVESEKDAEDSEQVSQPLNEQRFFPVGFPFTEKDVVASFDEEESKLTITIKKNEEHRKFIQIN